MITVSLIVPIYKPDSKQLDEMLNSIRKQTLSDIQPIFIIDDQETELDVSDIKNAIIINNLASLGTGMSRNKGLLKSEGTYITFLDQDDYISDNYLQELYETAIESDADLVVTNNVYEFGESTNIPEIHCNNYSVNVMDKLELFYNEDPEISLSYCVWGKLYKSSIIRKYEVGFPCIKLGSEDSYFNFIYFNHLKSRVYFNNNAIYHYRLHENNRTKTEYSKNKDSFENTIKIYVDALNYYKYNYSDSTVLKAKMFNAIFYNFWVYDRHDIEGKSELYDMLRWFTLKYLAPINEGYIPEFSRGYYPMVVNNETFKEFTEEYHKMK